MSEPLVWIDCEMTGLDRTNDVIIEICCIVTDNNLKVLSSEPFIRAISLPESRLEAMGDWCKTHHKETGLWDRVVESKVSHDQAAKDLIEFVSKYAEKGKGVLAGNSVHADKEFMRKDMPAVLDYLHYRIIDVSTFKEVCRRCSPKLFEKLPAKKYVHSAHEDILESIAELQWYLDNYLKSD